MVTGRSRPMLTSPVRAEQPPDVLRPVRDVEEAARLRAVAVHGDRPAGERLLGERRQDGAEGRRLAGPGHVEEAAHDHGEAVLAGVGERERLARGLAGRVREPQPVGEPKPEGPVPRPAGDPSLSP